MAGGLCRLGEVEDTHDRACFRDSSEKRCGFSW